MRWRILAVMVLARLVLGLSFQSAGAATPELVRAFGLDLSQIGFLVGAFMLPGIVLALPTGLLGVKWGDLRVVLAGFAFLVAGLVLSSLSPLWEGVVVGRILTGAGAVPLLILMTKMMFDWFAGSRELFWATSIFILGWPVGHAAGQTFLPTLAVQEGWPAPFLAVAAVGAASLVSLAAIYAPPPDAAAREQGPLSQLSRREFRQVTLAGLIWMSTNGAYAVLLSFGPDLMAERGMGAVAAAQSVSLMPWAFLIALPLGAWVATQFAMSNVVMVGSLVMSALAAFWAAMEPSAAAFLIFGFSAAFGASVLATLPVEALSTANRAAGLGYYFGWYFLGSAVLPAAAGWAGDIFGSAQGGMMVAAAAQTACLPFLLLLWRSRKLGVEAA